MSAINDPTLVMLGLTGAGKTNFLVALDVILDQQSDPRGLVHADLAADRAYLQPLREQWLAGAKLERTSRLQPQPHELIVRDPATGTRATFYIPDLAGEVVDSYFVTRTLPSEFCDRVSQAGGLLLFMHAAQNTILDVIEKQEAAGDEPAEKVGTSWRLEDAAPQVKLVDLLQFVAEVRRGHPAIRTAVILSAWDLVESAPRAGPRAAADIPNDPSEFFVKHWPLLDQFLSGHTREFAARVYGVSARGGGHKASDIDRLTSVMPRERVLVIDDAVRSNDLTRPVRWLLRLPELDTAK